MEDGVHVGDEEVPIFKYKEYKKIDPCHKKKYETLFFYRGSVIMDAQPHKVVEKDGSDHYKNKDRLTPCIEKQTYSKKPNVFKASKWKQEIDDEGDR